MKQKDIEKKIALLEEMISDPRTPEDEKEGYRTAMAEYKDYQTKGAGPAAKAPKKERKPSASAAPIPGSPHDYASDNMLNNEDDSDSEMKRFLIKDGKLTPAQAAIAVRGRIHFIEHRSDYKHGIPTHADVREYLEKEGFFKAEGKGDKPKKKKEKREKPEFLVDGKSINEMDCEELLSKVKARREADLKSGAKSRSKPVMERAAKNVATAVKQAIEEIPAADIADAPAAYLKKIERVEEKARDLVKELKELAGESLAADKLDKAFAGLTELISELKKNHK